jgi:hypothetical protein
VTDDSDAINRAISDGNRCGPWVCQSSTDSPAVVYFPSGTYLIAKPIVMYYSEYFDTFLLLEVHCTLFAVFRGSSSIGAAQAKRFSSVVQRSQPDTFLQ